MLSQTIQNPESGILNSETARRLRWRCRRGMLELDIVLGRFVGTHYADLDASQRVAFEALLDMPDTTLWDMITGRESLQQSEFKSLLEMINAA